MSKENVPLSSVESVRPEIRARTIEGERQEWEAAIKTARGQLKQLKDLVKNA